MQNLKIKVNTAEESKEVQELLFELGYEWYAHGKTISYLDTIATDDFGYLVAWKTGCFSKHIIQMGCGKEDAKETTLAELRDMVVLKRSNRTDANAEEENGLYDLYLTKSGDLYFYHCGKNEWILSSISGDESYYKSLKPIEKPMQEYLNTETYEYKLAHTKPDGDWVEIPKGATHYAEDSNFGIKKKYFFRCPDDAMWVDSQWMRASFSVANQNVLWVRLQQPEALPFIDDMKAWERKPVGRCLMIDIDDDELKSLNDQYAEIEQVRQQSIEATLAERGSRYGDFESVAETTRALMCVLGDGDTFDELSALQYEALHMICSKMARIVNGDPDYKDNWHDIGGYAKLVENNI